MRDFLRSLPVFAGSVDDFDVTALPDEPALLFERWLRDAVQAGAAEPHSMTLSTCDVDGTPDARVLILKDLDDRGWWFATNADSPKGRQLAAHPTAALTFYWPVLARQVRVRGPVAAGPPDLSAADFRSRGLGARAVALASTESQPLQSRVACETAVMTAKKLLGDHPELVSPTWSTYVMDAMIVEFWQADTDRMHARVQYSRQPDHWGHILLWP